MTELSTVAIIFLVLVVALQVFALRTYNSEILWARSDYVWLSVAALALISLTADARMDEARALVPAYEGHLRGMEAITEDDVYFSLNYLKFFSEVRVRGETDEIALQKKDFSKLRSKLLPYREAVSTPGWSSTIDAFHSRQELLSGLSSPAAVERATHISEGMERVKGSYEDLRRLQKRLQPSPLERFRVYLEPLLAAAALAIRIGKTTAEVTRKKFAAGRGAVVNLRDRRKRSLPRRLIILRRRS